MFLEKVELLAYKDERVCCKRPEWPPFASELHEASSRRQKAVSSSKINVIPNTPYRRALGTPLE